MKTKLLLFGAVFLGLNLNSSAQCSPATNASITISTTSLLTNSHPSHIKICSTGIVYDTASGMNRTFYLETGAQLYLKNNPTTFVYLKTGSTLINKGGVSAIMAYAEASATITNQGNPPANTNTCASVNFPATPACAVNGISENSFANFLTFYPMPAGNNLTILNDNKETLNGVFINALGQKVKCVTIESGKKNIDVSGMTEGIYFLNINDKNNSVVTKRILINR